MKKLRVLFGVLLLLSGCAFFLYPNFREWKTQQEVNQIITNFQDSSSVPAVESGQRDGVVVDEEESDGVLFSDLYYEMREYNESLVNSGQNILDAWSYEQAPTGLSSLDSDTIGYIEIPDMKVRLPLYLGASNENLAKGAAVLSGTSMPIGGESTNCVIAGHRGWRGSAYFQYIENMEVGSLVYVTNPWETLTYKVIGFDIVNPTDVDCIQIQEGKDMVTLISCHPYVLGGGKYRYLVFCERAQDEAGVEDWEGSTMAKESEKAAAEETQVDGGVEWVTTEYSDMDLLEWEIRLRTLLPAFTMFLAGGIILIRCRKKVEK